MSIACRNDRNKFKHSESRTEATPTESGIYCTCIQAVKSKLSWGSISIFSEQTQINSNYGCYKLNETFVDVAESDL